MRHRDDIDGLRAIAVLPVILYHFDLGPFSGGYVGVDIFFVISGFLITSIIAREIEAGHFSLIAFYERRIRRIFPAAFAMVGAVTIAGWILMPSMALERLSVSTLFTSVYATNILFWKQSGYFDPRADTQPLLHTWSLSVEEQFYIVFPLLLLAAFAILRRRMIWVVIVLTIGSFLVSWMLTDAAPEAAFYLIPTRAWELGTGAVLALINSGRPLQRLRIAPALIAASGVALIAVAIFCFDDQTHYPGVAALVPCLGAALLLLAGGDDASNSVSAGIGHPILRYVGLISYSLYLWHWPVLVFARYFTLPDPIDLTGRMLLLLGIWLLSDLSWRFIETPFRTRRWLPTRRGIFGFFGATTALLLVFGGVGTLGNGLPWRLSASTLALEAGSLDGNPLRRSCHEGDYHIARIEDFCVYGDKARPPAYALWGDSHGVELAYALGSLLAESGASLKSFTMAQCPPATPYPKADCDAHNNAVLDYLTAHREIGTVYLIADYRRYITPGRKASFDAGFLAAARALAAAGRKVVVIHPVPVPGYPVPEMAAILDRLGKDPRAGAIPRESYERQYAEQNEFLEAALTGPAYAHAYPADALCSGPVCETVRDGRTLYFDDNHLSLFGAGFVVARLRVALQIPPQPAAP